MSLKQLTALKIQLLRATQPFLPYLFRITFKPYNVVNPPKRYEEFHGHNL